MEFLSLKEAAQACLSLHLLRHSCLFHRYKWKFNGKDFNPSGQDDRVVQLPNAGTIVFNAPEDKDEGIYQCFATNDLGVSASVKINLREAKLAKFPIEKSTVRVCPNKKICFGLIH